MLNINDLESNLITELTPEEESAIYGGGWLKKIAKKVANTAADATSSAAGAAGAVVGGATGAVVGGVGGALGFDTNIFEGAKIGSQLGQDVATTVV